ncbi:MAG: hypothetical protein EBU67_05725 [Actinobacteria bacterium]|nr:hypothetical protein [Actinomycetota bacterium]
MSFSAGLLTGRWRTDGAVRVAFEGPFGDEKRTSMSETDAGASIAGLRELLMSHGVVPGSRVGVLSNHRIETYLAVLAVVSTGAAFVPLNPKFPADPSPGQTPRTSCLPRVRQEHRKVYRSRTTTSLIMSMACQHFLRFPTVCVSPSFLISASTCRCTTFSFRCDTGGPSSPRPR